MPQLDTVTYFSQVFWLLVLFITLYYIIVTIYLPKIAYIMKYRAAHELDRSSFILSITNEIKALESPELTPRHIKTIKNISSSMTSQVNTWYQSALTNTKLVELNNTNEIYVNNISLYPAYNYVKSDILSN